jgi:hypothetical protein
MKFNWGTKIAILYIGFIGLIIFMVVKSFGEKYDLVTEDYYAKEIAYQSQIDSRQRAESLDRNLRVEQSKESLSIVFPHEDGTQITGTVNCFRPSNQSLDFEEKVDGTKNVFSIDKDRFKAGKYRVKVNWKADGKDFFTEEIVVIR